MSSPASGRGGTPILLWACVFASGFSGLVYEVVWARYLSILFGNTTYAYTVVLATFMGGLALGALVLGRLADAAREKLLLYAAAEMGIAISCAMTPRIFAAARGLYPAAATRYPPHSVPMAAVMFAVGASIMLLPAALMGGTVPILSAATTRARAARGKAIARLYCCNSLGAALGALACGYLFIGRFGLGLTIVMASGINLLAGATALGMRVLGGAPTPSEWGDDGAAGGGGDGGYAGAPEAIALCALFVSGAATMLYELVWARLFSIVLGSSTYSFSATLAAFISGITLGAYIVARFPPREGAALRLFAACEACAGACIAAAAPFYAHLPRLFLLLSRMLSRRPEAFILHEGAKLVLCLLVMLPPTVFLGMTLPLGGIVVARRRALFGRKVGAAFAFNAAGNILGAAAAGLLLIPLAGMQSALKAGVALNLALAAILACADRGISPPWKAAFSAACAAACAAALLLPPAWNRLWFTLQAYRPRRSAGALSASWMADGRRILYDRDGPNASVAVVEHEGYRFLFINGKADASTRHDMPTQVLLAALPLALAPSAREVLVIGLGSGVTAGAALLFPVDGVDIVEISPEVVEAAAYFSDENRGVLNDPRARVAVEDARTFMRRAGRRYDLIVSEPSNPWMSGVGDLFSIEHFGACLGALREGGAMAQWIHTYEMDDDTFKIVVKTFCSVFPEASLWETGGNNVLLLGTRRGLRPDFASSERLIASPPLARELARWGVADMFTLLSLQIASDAAIRGSVHSERTVNSVYAPVVEYRAPRALFTDSTVRTYIEHLDERRFPADRGGLLLKSYLDGREPTAAELRRLCGFLEKAQGGYNAYLALPALDALLRKAPADGDAAASYLYSELAPLRAQMREAEGRIRSGERDMKLLEFCASLRLKQYYLLRSFLQPRLVPETIDALAQCARLAGRRAGAFHYLMGKIHLGEREYREAFSCYRRAEEAAGRGGDRAPADRP
jgi:predicted membrane-bound spermidine synthase